MSFKDLINDDVSDVFLNTEEFAESFRVHEPNGGTRTITATVADERIEYERTPNGQREVAVLELLVTNSDTTGIATPEKRMYVTRVAENDTQIQYALETVLEQDNGALLIQFKNRKHTRGGHESGRFAD